MNAMDGWKREAFGARGMGMEVWKKPKKAQKIDSSSSTMISSTGVRERKRDDRAADYRRQADEMDDAWKQEEKSDAGKKRCMFL